MDDAQRSPAWWRRYSSLDLGRVAALAYSLIGLASLAPQLFTDRRSAPVLPLGLIGIVGLAAVIIVTFARRRLFVGEPLVSPVLMFLAGIALADPYAAIGLAQRLVPPQSLYGSITTTAVRTVLICVALPLVVLNSPTASNRAGWNSPSVFGSIPSIILLAALIRVLQAAVIRQIDAAERVRLLISSGTKLLNLTDVEQVRALTRETANELARRNPGTVAILLRLGENEAVVMGLAGADRPSVGSRLPSEPFHRLTRGGPDSTQVGILTPHVGELWWRGAAATMAGECWLVIVGAPDPVSDDVLDAFTLLAGQRTEGEIKCRAHAELAYRAGHDTITDLYNRGEFVAQLERIMRDARAAEVAVIVMDLDDFKMVNDTYGHQAGDQMLRIVADRLSEVLADASPPTGIAARLGGDEFAVLVAADRREQIAAVANAIHRRLQQPLTTGQVTIPVWTSLGLAYRTEGMAATELLDNADLAMYRAKESGKRRVAEYTPGMAAMRSRAGT